MGRKISVTFRCRICGMDTETVQLLPKGDDSNYCTSDAIQYNFGSETMVVSENEATKVEQALSTSDPVALYAIHPRFLATYCPVCQACYCRNHWEMMELPDPVSDWYSMHYDTFGTCPSGHQRLMAKDGLFWPKEEKK